MKKSTLRILASFWTLLVLFALASAMHAPNASSSGVKSGAMTMSTGGGIEPDCTELTTGGE